MRHKTRLRQYRKNIALKKGTHPNNIFTNEIVENLMKISPQRMQDFRLVRGFGKMKIDAYGQDILDIFQSEDREDTLDLEGFLNDYDYNLSSAQKKILNKAYQGENLFMTGPGGVGKSLVIQLIVKVCLKQAKIVQVCGMTGAAASLLNNAITLHAFSGTRIIRDASIEEIVARVKKNKKASSNWRKIDTLIIDEVSMLSKRFFEILNIVAQKIRNNDLPFGGIQVIFSGDFYQIPPVADRGVPDSGKFCFEGELWQSIFPPSQVIVMNEVFRQNDPKYIKILRQTREGRISEKTYHSLLERVGQSYDPKDPPAIITPTRSASISINESEMRKIKSKGVRYRMIINQDQRDYYPHGLIEQEIKLLKKTVMEEELTLKVGAKVMCVANLDMTSDKPIVNGSQGIILSFESGYPLVHFENGRQKLIEPHKLESESIEGLSIEQVPLILSWAITTHKSQGITLERALIDAGSDNFEYGQIYVALSRVKRLEGIYLINFDHNKIKANPCVKRYYESLSKK